MYNHGGMWDMSRKQGRLQGPGFPWAQVSRRSDPLRRCFALILRSVFGGQQALLIICSVPSLQCIVVLQHGAGQLQGQTGQGWRWKGGWVCWMSCCMAARTPDWAEGSHSNKTTSLNTQRTFSVVTETTPSEPGQTSGDLRIQPYRVERICRVECKHLPKSR